MLTFQIWFCTRMVAMEPSEIIAALIITIIAILLILFVIRLYNKYTNAMCTSAKRLDERIAIVTGGTSGIGLEIAKDLARRGAKVIIACPFEKEGLSAAESILKEIQKAKVVFKLLDLGSLKSVREFSEDILKTEVRLDLLINNAGIAVPQDFQTEDGINFVMQVNFYGHFLLTILLLPLLKKTGHSSEPSRIINTSSVSHYIGTVNMENMNMSGYYCLPIFLYCNSKFAAILFSRELSKRLRGANVVVNNVDPGAVGTRIWHSYGKFLGIILTGYFYHIFRTPQEGAQTALHVALDEEAGKVSGEVFHNCRQSRARRAAYRDDLAEQLWEQSVKLVKLTNVELDQSLSENASANFIITE